MSTRAETRFGVWATKREHKTLAEHAFGTLREAIQRGDLRAGERLSIDELSSELDMSKMPIRDALRRLEAVGLVETRRYRGTRVTEISIDDLRDVCRTRLAVETLAVRCAAERFSDDDTARARGLLDHLNALTEDDPELWPVHRSFHWLFFEASGSRWLPRVIGPLWDTSERYQFAAKTAPLSEQSRREHAHILKCCIARDPEAAAIAHHVHVIRTANAVAEALGRERTFEPLAAVGGARGGVSPGSI